MKLILICACAFVFVSGAYGVEKEEAFKTLDAGLAQVRAESGSPGLAVGIVKDGAVFFAKGYGTANLETGAPVTTQTLFHLASITKTFVGTAVMQEVEAGKVRLDDPIVRHLPYFKLKDERYPVLTVGQFLSHTSGMPDTVSYNWNNPEYDDGALERYVRSLGNRTLMFEPGEKFRYSNIAYEVLGDLIAKTSGVSFEDYVKEHILKPLKMNDSNLLIKEVDERLLAMGYVKKAGGGVEATGHYAYNRRHAPSSTLHSNIEDLCRWALANLARGELDGARILKSETCDQMRKPVATTSGEGSGGQIGLSWFLREVRGRRAIGHSGSDTGYRTDLLLFPDDHFGVVVLCNYSGADNPVGRARDLAIDAVVGLLPRQL